MRDRTKRIIALSARIHELRSEADRIENELEKVLGGKESTAEATVEAAPQMPRPEGNGHKKRTKFGTGHVVPQDEFEAGVLRMLQHKTHVSLTEVAQVLHASVPRARKILRDMKRHKLVKVETVKVPAGKRQQPVDKFTLVHRASPVVEMRS